MHTINSIVDRETKTSRLADQGSIKNHRLRPYFNQSYKLFRLILKTASRHQRLLNHRIKIIW